MFQRASSLSKAVFLFLVLAGVLAAKAPYPLAAGYGVILVVAALCGLPWFRIMVLSLYSAVFTVLYIISLRGGVLTHTVLVFKAITPALAVLTFVVSTPYPKIFSLLSAFLPEILASGLFMTYRTFFILIEMMDNFGAAIRLRGGFSPGSLHKNSANISRGIAMLLVKAVERSSRLYAVMAVRGYNGSMAQTGVGGFHRQDVLPIGTGIAVLMLALLWR